MAGLNPGRFNHIGLGRRHAGTPVLVLVHDLHIRVSAPAGNYSATYNSTRPGTTNHGPTT